MPITLVCKCGKKVSAKEEVRGKRVKCPGCGAVLLVKDPGQTPPVKREREAPLLLSLARAEAVGKPLAQKYRAPKTFQNFANLDPTLVANARASFAGGMSDAETPLVLLDRSSRKDGKKGILITNRQVYSSFLSKPIALANVLLAHVERPSHLQELRAGTQQPAYTLVVNGVDTLFGTDKFHFLADLMTELGRAFREEHGLVWKPGPPGGDGADDRLPRVAAALVCVRRSEDEVVQILAGAGMDEAATQQMVAEMNAIRNRRPKVLPLLLILSGPVLLLFAAVMALDRHRDGPERILGPLTMGFLGVCFPVIGLYRLLTGITPWRTHELLKAWQSKRR